MRVTRRNPFLWLALINLAACLGIGSRRFSIYLPGFVAAYAGDTLWATAAFLGVGLFLPRTSTRWVAALAMTLSVAVEVSQLYHAPWIDSIRRTTLGGLVLGYGFVWSDLECYAVGVGLGVVIDEDRLARPSYREYMRRLSGWVMPDLPLPATGEGRQRPAAGPASSSCHARIVNAVSRRQPAHWTVLTMR
jgi:hypothetical protein